MSYKILCGSDFHLGRRTRKLPDHIDPTKCSPATVWNRFVDKAIECKVDTVLLAGDIVDQDNRYYESIGVLERGINRLIENNTRVFAVAGNHDFDTLHQVASRIQAFTVLGKGGIWESVLLEKDGREILQLSGWSFSKQHIKTNPLLDFKPSIDSRLSKIGLLHCDANASGSRYAPVSASDFLNTNMSAWVLGHIHRPSIIQPTPLTFYCGSPQGLDPTEIGIHGAWLLEINSSGIASSTLLPLAELRWESGNLDMEGVQTEEEFRLKINAVLEELHESQTAEDPAPYAIGYRLYLRGRSSIYRLLDQWAEEAKLELQREIGGTTYFFESIKNETKPDLNLDDLARVKDPPGILAAKLKILESKEPPGDYQMLIENAVLKLRDTETNPNYQVKESEGELSEEAIRQMLIKSGMYALEQLLAQQGESL